MADALTDSEKDSLVSLLGELVAIPSENSEAVSAVAPEASVAEFVHARLEQLGMTVEVLHTDDGRPNVLGYWPDGRQAPLVLTAHMDTVSAEGMTIEPFAGEIRDGRIYGRGTCDTKGSLAVFLWMLDVIRQSDRRLRNQVRFLAVCDEENFCRGSRFLVDKGFRADQMIVGEPTECRVAPLHRGVIALKLRTMGKAVHTSVAHTGTNAIYGMLDLLNHVRSVWIGALEQQTHPLLGHGTAAVTIIRGGQRTNIVPDRCEATIDARTLPGQDGEALVASLRSQLEALATSKRIAFELEPIAIRPALDTDRNDPLVRRFLNAQQAMGEPAEVVGLPFLTDASSFASSGAVCVVFGPGRVEQAHSPDEYLELEQLFLAASILRNFFEDQGGR